MMNALVVPDRHPAKNTFLGKSTNIVPVSRSLAWNPSQAALGSRYRQAKAVTPTTQSSADINSGH
jgi:hypothetical protein